MAKPADLRAKSDDQLSADLADLKKEAFNLRFQAATNQLERPARIKEVRRDIARIKTLQAERTSASAMVRRIVFMRCFPVDRGGILRIYDARTRTPSHRYRKDS